VIVTRLPKRPLAAAALLTAVAGIAASASRSSSGAIDPPVPEAFAPVRLVPIPAWVAVRCKQIQRHTRAPLLCPTLLPRPFAAGVPTLPPRGFVVGSTGDWFRRRIAGVDIGYGAPWEPGSGPGRRQHLWRNRPCCFLHFDVFRRAPGRAAIPPKARPARLGGRSGLLAKARAGASYGGELYWANHVRFLWRERGVNYVATLHSFGERATERLLGRLIASLRPVHAIRVRAPRGTAVGSTPNALASGEGSVWVGSLGDTSSNFRGTVYRIDRRTGRVLARIHPGPGVHALAFANGSLWTATWTQIVRVEPRTGRRQALLDVGRWPRALASRAGRLWAVDAAPFGRIRGALVRIDPRTARVTGRVPLGRAPVGIAVTPQAVWVTDELDDELLRIDTKRLGVVDRIAVGRMPTSVVAGAGALWVANTGERTVSRVDPQTLRTTTLRVGSAPRGLAVGAGSVWVACTAAGTLWRIDPEHRGVAVAARTLGDPLAVAVAADQVWVATNAEGRLIRLPLR
jgi:streptogramin lyase